jgi:hypothetical protein
VRLIEGLGTGIEFFEFDDAEELQQKKHMTPSSNPPTGDKTPHGTNQEEPIGVQVLKRFGLPVTKESWLKLNFPEESMESLSAEREAQMLEELGLEFGE